MTCVYRRFERARFRPSGRRRGSVVVTRSRNRAAAISNVIWWRTSSAARETASTRCTSSSRPSKCAASDRSMYGGYRSDTNHAVPKGTPDAMARVREFPEVRRG